MSGDESEPKLPISAGLRDICFGTLFVGAGGAAAPLILDTIGMHKFIQRALPVDPFMQNGFINVIGAVGGSAIYVLLRLASPIVMKIARHKYFSLFANSLYLTMMVFLILAVRRTVIEISNKSAEIVALKADFDTENAKLSKLQDALGDFQNSLAYLPEMKRAVVLMHDLQQYKYLETAEQKEEAMFSADKSKDVGLAQETHKKALDSLRSAAIANASSYARGIMNQHQNAIMGLKPTIAIENELQLLVSRMK